MGNLELIFGPGGFDPLKHEYKPPPPFDLLEAIREFTDQLVALGFLINGLAIADEKIHRVKRDGDKNGSRNAWYVLNSGERFAVGSWGSWKDPDINGTWCSADRNPQSVSPEEREEIRRQIEELKKRQEEETKAGQDHTAGEVQYYLEGLEQEFGDAKYLRKKQVGTRPGLKRDGDAVVIPLCNEAGEIRSCQTIFPNSDKLFTKGGQKKGCFYAIPGDEEWTGGTVLIAEGYATGYTLHEASGYMVYIAFDAYNIVPVAEIVRRKHPDSRIIVCADNDENKVGIDNANKAAKAIGAYVIFPEFPPNPNTNEKLSDFNDLMALCGLESVKDALGLNKEPAPIYCSEDQEDNEKEYDPSLIEPPGILKEICSYYNATSKISQPGFAVQCALAVCSSVLGRIYRTDADNRTSLYFLNIGKSATGKEHIKIIVDRIFEDSGLGNMVVGSGYTSAGAVFSTLISKPSHICVIDEMGKYLEATSNKANINGREANKIIMEAIGRTEGIMRPVNYSLMAASSATKKSLEDRKIYNPAITLVGMTTPSTFYENISLAQIKDGFLGRFIIHNSIIGRKVPKNVEIFKTPQKIIDWIHAVRKRFYDQGNLMEANVFDSQIDPGTIMLKLSSGAIHVFNEFAKRLIKVMDRVEVYGLDGMCGRSREFAMRMSLIVALAINPYATEISEADAAYSVHYIETHMQDAILNIKENMTESDYEKDKLEILNAIRLAKGRGVTLPETRRMKPFSRWTVRQREVILGDLREAGLIDQRDISPKGSGRPRKGVFVAIEQPKEDRDELFKL